MRALVVGCGSAARRHIANLTRTDAVGSIAVATGHPACLESIADRRKVRLVPTWRESGADFAIVANETHRHLDVAAALAAEGLDLLIEKPLSHTLDGVEELRESAGRTGARVLVGYNLRFLGALALLRRWLADGVVGEPCFARIEVGQHLASWRPGTDYRASYSAHAERGGGAALDLSHEVDYMRMLFGDPESWQVARARVGRLEIDADDLFEGLYRYPGGFLCSVHLDYLEERRRRRVRVVGSAGTLACDLVGKELRVTRPSGERALCDEALFDVEGTYAAELRHFLEVVRGGSAPLVALEDGIAALRLLGDNDVPRP